MLTLPTSKGYIDMKEITISELKGLNIGQLYELIFLQTRARVEKERKFCGYYKALKLFIEPNGKFLIEKND